MPGIPKVLLRLFRPGVKRGRNNPGFSQSCQTQRAADDHKNESESRRDLDGSGNCATTANGESKSQVDMAFPVRHRPLACLEEQNEGIKLATILLNQPLESLRQELRLLWGRSVFKAAADGGSNRLYECMMGNHHKYIPDIVTGDFDSIRPEILLYYKSRGSKIIETPDQNYTDFTKCLRIVIEEIDHNVPKLDAIMVLGAFGERFDQTMSNLNTLYEANGLTKVPVYLLAGGSLGCILRPGTHAIEVNTGLEDDWCGLIPVGCKCQQVTTTGLKWNLDHQPMQFGGLISTSNTYAEGAEVVTVQTDQPLLWTMGFKNISTLKPSSR